MATEIDIPVSVSSQQGEREDDAFSSEFLEGKVTEHPGNKVKQLESGPNQPLETSSHVAETVNTQLESDKRTDEGGIFFQALSVPVVTDDEHINTPDSCETTTTEDQEDKRTTKIETFTEGKTNDDERVAVIAPKDTDDHNVVEAISGQTKGSIDHVLGLIKGSDKGIEEVTEFSKEDESMGGSSNAKTEAGEEEDLKGKNYNNEGKEPEIVKTKENIEEDNEEIRPSVETGEKTENEGLSDGITTDVCVSTQTKTEEGTTEDEEKKDESEEGLEHSDSIAPSKQEIASKDEDHEKEHALNMLENDQRNEDDVTSSQDATTVAYLKEQDLNETPKEILKEETEDKSVDAQEESKQCEDEARDEREQKPVESVDKTVHSSSEIEQEEQTELITPIVEIEEKMEQKGLLHEINTDSCISTQTKSQLETTEQEEKDEEEAAEVCEETVFEKVESEKEVKVSESSDMKLEEKAIAILNKDADPEKEQEVDMSENGQDEDNITSSQDVTFEAGLQKTNHHSELELVGTKEVIEEDTEETEYRVKPLEPEEGTPENEKKNEEEVIGSEKKSGSLMVKEVCEEVVSEKAESEEVALNENVIASKDEDQDTEQELYVSEKGQGGGDDVTSSQNASSGDIKETTTAQHAMPEDILKDEEDNRIIDPQEESEQCETEAKDEREQKPEESVNKIVRSCLEIEQEEDTEETKPTDEKLEQQGLLHAITTDPESAEHEEHNKEETTESDDGRKENSDNPPVRKLCEETGSEMVESEGVKFSDDSSMKQDEKAIAMLSKDEDEDQEKEHELNTSEKDQGEDDVTCPQDSTFTEDLQAKNYDEGKELKFVTARENVEEVAEENNEEKAIESDDVQKEISESPLSKEACEDTALEKVENEEVIRSDSSNMKLDEKVSNPDLCKDEDQQTEQKVNMSEKDKGEDEPEGNEAEVVRTKEGIEEDTEEIMSSVETIEKIEQQRLIHAKPEEETTEEKNEEEAIESDDGQTKKSGSPMVELCEETVPEKADEYEEGLKEMIGGDDVTGSQNASSEDIKEMIGQHATKVAYLEEVQGMNAMIKDPLKEEANDRSIVPQQASEQYENEANDKGEPKPEENIHSCSEIEQEEYAKEIKPSVETEVKEEQEGLMHISTQTESQAETGEHEEKNKEVIECDDSRKEKSDNPSIKEVCEEIDAAKVEYDGVEQSDNSGVKLNEKAVAILSKDEDQEKEQELNMSEQDQHEDDVPSSQDATSVEDLEAKNHDGEGKEPEFVETRESTEEDNEEIKSSVESKEKVEPQGLLHANDAITTDVSISTETKSQEIIESNDGRKEKSDNVSVKEVCEDAGLKKVESEEDQHEDDVPSSQDATSVEDLQAKNHDGEGKEPELVETRESTEEDNEEIKSSVESEEKIEPQGLLHANDAITTDVSISTQTKSQEIVESNDGQEEKSDNALVKEVCEDAGLKKVESEEELNMSEQDQHEDDVPSSQDATSVEDLQAKNHDGEGKEPEFVETRGSTEEDNEEIKSSVESEEKVEPQGLLHAITTDVSISTQTNSQEIIESNDGQTEKSDNVSVKEVCEEAGLKKVESEEGTKLSDSSDIELNGKAIEVLSKDEDQEKEQELAMPKENTGEDEVTCSQDASSKKDLEGKNHDGEHIEPELVENGESIKEDIEVIRTNVETEESKEQQGSLSAIMSDVCISAQTESKEETTKNEEKNEESIESYEGRKEQLAIPCNNEASEQDEDGAKNKSEQGLEGSDNKPVHSHSELGEATIRENETDEGNKEEAYFEEPKYEAEEAGDGTECKTAGGTQKISPENKDDTIADESKSTEGIPQDVDMSYDKAGSPLAEETEDEKLNNKEEWYLDSETQVQKGDVSKKVDQEDSYAAHEQNSINTLEQEKSISDELQKQVEKESQEDSKGHQSEDSRFENLCTTGQDILEEVGEKTTMEPEKITEQAFQESESETNKEIEAKLDAENQVDGKEDKSEMNDEVVLTEKPTEQKVEEILACQTTTMSEKTEDETAQKDEDLSLGSMKDTNDNATKEEKSFLDGRTREIDIFTLEHEPVGEKITKQAFQESESETNKEIAQLDAENQVGEKEDRNKMNDDVVLAEKVSLELGQPTEQNVDEIQACQTTIMSENTEDEIAQKDEDLSRGSIEDTNDNTTKEEKRFLDGKTREIEISTLEHEPVEEKITEQAFQESESETNKEIEAKLDAENPADGKEDKTEINDEVVLAEKPMEQNVEILACQTTTMSEKTKEEIAEKDEDFSLGRIEDTSNTIKEEKSFLDERTTEIEISTLEHEPVGENITKQTFQESESEAKKEIEAKLDAENQVDGKEDKSEMNDEVVLTEKISLELGQPMEQNVEKILACQTTTMSEKTEEEIAEKDEDLSLGSIEDTSNTIKEEKSFLDERTTEIEISTLQHEPVEENITKQAFEESESETKKEIEAKLDAENQADGKEDKSEMNDEVVLTEKISLELGQPMEQNVEEIQACQSTTMSENTEDEIAQKDKDLSRGSIEDTNDSTTKEEKSFLDGRTREIEISTLEHEPVGEKITTQAFQESKSETNKEIEAKLDAENQVDETEDKTEMNDEVVLTEKVSSELGQPMEQNAGEIQACQTKTMSENTEDKIAKNDEDLSRGGVEDTNDYTKEEKIFHDRRTREIEISTLEHEHVEEKNGGRDEVSKRECTDLTETIAVELQEDIMPSRSLGTSTEDTPNSEEPKADENLPIEDLDSVSEVQIPRVVPKSEDSKLKEECLTSVNTKSVDEERGTVTKEISSDEISYSDPIPVENPEVTEVRVDAQIRQEDLQPAEDISCESKASSSIQALKMDMKEGPERIRGEVKNDGVDEAPKQERIPTLEDAANFEPQVDLSNIESTYSSKSEKSPTQALEAVCDVQTPEVVLDSEESKMKEERIVLATAGYTDENNGEEEQEIKTNESSSAEKKEQTTESKEVVEHPSMLCPDAVLIEDQNETMKNVILTEKVVVETEKEEGITEVKGQDSEEDNCPTELEKTSNQKELANEIEYSKSIPIGNTEVAEVNAESQRELITISEDLSCLSKASIGEVKDDSVDEASRSERVPILEDAKALELQVNLPEIEILEEEATENRKEGPNHESEKEEKDDGLISETQTPEALLKVEMKEEHLEATNASCETLTSGLSSEKLLDEVNIIDAKEDTEIIVRGEEKAAEDSYQEAAVEVTAHDSQTEEKPVSMVPPEELASPTAEDQTNELVSGTDKTKVEHSNISNKGLNPELMEEEFTNLSENQRSIKEKYIEEEGQGKFGVENKEAKSGNEVVEDVIVNEVLLEVEKAKESDSMKDSIDEEASCVPNQLTSATDEVCQIKRLNSSPNELLEAKDSVEDIEDPKLMAGNLNLEAETFTVKNGPNDDMKQDVEKTSEIVASEFERLENMVTKEKILEADVNKEKETLDEPQADDPAKTTSDSLLSSTEQDREVRSEESSGHGDMHKLEEPTEVFELTSEVDEVVAEGKEVSAKLTEKLPEASPEILLVKHDPETTATTEKIEEEIKDKDETLVNRDFSTSTKEEACLLIEKTGELQVSTSEDNALLSQNDKKIADLPVLPSVRKEIIQDEDKRFEETPAIDNQKHENDLDYTAKATIVDVVSNAECPEIEQQHFDSKEATVEPINQENQSEQKKEADENIEGGIPIEKVPKQTAACKEIANEFLVMPLTKQEEKLNYLQDHSKEQEYSGERTYQDLEAVKEPSQIDELSDKVKKAEPIDIQEETMAGGNLHEEETEKRTNITEATVNLHHGEKGDETNCKATSTEAAIPIENVKSSDVELKRDMIPVPKCASTRNPEVRSAILEVLSVMDATADKAGYNKDPNDKTAEAHVAEKGVLKEDVHLESTCNKSKTTEKVSGTNQEPYNLPLTKERSMELDAPVTPGTAATEDVKISQKYVTDDLIKISQIQPELQKYEVSACAVDKQLPDKPYQNESMESKLLTGNMNASHEQGEPTANSLNAKAKDLKPTNASDTEPQCSSEVVKEEKKISDEKKSETPEPATNVFTDTLHESTQGNSKVAENLIEEREPALTKDQQVDKEETVDNGAKTDDEDEAEEDDDDDNQKMGSCSDAPVMIEASKDMDVKVHKKSHNILSGVGSKVKHSIAKVKKAITGKSSHPKPPSPKSEIK